MDNFKLALDELVQAHIGRCSQDLFQASEFVDILTDRTLATFVSLLLAFPEECRDEIRSSYMDSARQRLEEFFNAFGGNDNDYVNKEPPKGFMQ